MRYPTYSELIFMNGMILGDEDIMTGTKKIRDIDLLLAAEQRPQSSAFGQDAYPTLKEKAAALLHSVARNHPFADGNKRTATIGALFMLRTNGAQIIWEKEQALQKILGLAEGHLEADEFARWLPIESVGVLPEPDMQQDTRLIEELISEHGWLLDELAQR